VRLLQPAPAMALSTGRTGGSVLGAERWRSDCARRFAVRLRAHITCLLLAVWCVCAPPRVTADTSALPAYEPVTALAGTLSSNGSDTLASLTSLWARAFSALYPAVRVQVQASGSATAPPALVEGTADLGLMSRRMKPSELQAFVARFGYEPRELPIAIDALAVFVHRDNPLRGVSLAQLDAIFSATQRCAAQRPLRSWGELGLQGLWASRPVSVYGRNSASGTHAFFRSAVLCQGDFDARVNELPGSASVVQAVGATLGGIGYASLGYATAGVRPLAVAAAEGQQPVLPSLSSAADRSYPLARFLYAYINQPPGRPLGRLEREFLRFIFSREGQRIVLQDGYVPLPASMARQLLAEAR
jgi:phosphate transport system substrate-binding protein